MAANFFCSAFAILQLSLASEVQPPRKNGVCVEAGVRGEGNDPGHVLIAMRAVRNKIVGGDFMPTDASHPMIADLHPAGVPGSAAGDQPRNDTASADPTLSASVVQNALLAANETDPFQGSRDPIADRERHDRDYIVDDDGPWLLPESGHGARPKYSKPHGPEEDVDMEEVKRQNHGLALRFVVPVAAVIFAVFTISNLMEMFGITAIPESLIMILIGVALGAFLKWFGNFDFFEDEEKFSKVMTSVLNLFLLPIIMFASGWAIRRRDFYSQFPYILLFAVGGSALSTCVVAALIYLTGMINLHSVTAGRTAFAYASLISATDPVATLSTYAKLKVDPLLNILVFGESVINDAVAIVFFKVYNSDHFMLNKRGEHLTGLGLLGSVVVGVAKNFLFSLAFGIGLAIVYTLIARWAGMHHNKKGQILVILASCYLTFALAESIGLSGIIAEIFCSLLMGVYMRPLLSTEGSLLTTFFVKQLAMLADACVFLLVGVSVVKLTTRGWYFGVWMMVFCLVGRFVSVYPLALITNATKTAVGSLNGVPREGWNLLSPEHMFMMWHAGLRGAIALALSLELGNWVDDIDGTGTRHALQTATFLIIIVFLIIFGGSTQACLQHLGISMGQDLPANHLSKTEDLGNLREILKWIDHTVTAPLLVGKTDRPKKTMEEERDVEDVLKHATIIDDRFHVTRTPITER